MVSSVAQFTPSQANLLEFTVRFSSILGILGAACTILAYIFHPPFRRSVISRLALSIAVSDLISISAQSLGRLGPDSGSDSFICLAQAVLQQYGQLSAVLFIACIARQLQLVVQGRLTASEIRRRDRWFIPVSVLLALASSIAPLFVHDDHGSPVYGDGYLWCYITSNAAKFYWILYVPKMVVGAGCIAVLVYARVDGWMWRRRRRKQVNWSRNDQHEFVPEETEIYALPGTISVYVFVYPCIWTPIIIAHLMKFLTPDGNIYLRTLTMAIFLPSRGLINAFASVYQIWRGLHLQEEEKRRRTKKLQQMEREQWFVRRKFLEHRQQWPAAWSKGNGRQKSRFLRRDSFCSIDW